MEMKWFAIIIIGIAFCGCLGTYFSEQDNLSEKEKLDIIERKIDLKIKLDNWKYSSDTKHWVDSVEISLDSINI